MFEDILRYVVSESVDLRSYQNNERNNMERSEEARGRNMIIVLFKQLYLSGRKGKVKRGERA